MTNVIAEIGINFGGNIDVAKDLIHQASRAGCWGVKFQFRNIETFYFVDNEIGDAIVRNEIQKNNLEFSQILVLQEYANELGLEFGMSFFRKEDLDFYLSHISDPDFYKVPSAECMNFRLVDALLQRQKKVFISTGGHRLEEIIDIYSNCKYKDIVILHCIANYPADLGIQNLSKIKKIAETHESGYSSHDVDYEVCIAAIAMGASWIERHLTNDKDGIGLDDSSSSTESEMKLICKFAKHADGIVGVSDCPPNQGEILNMQNLGTGLYLRRAIKSGTVLKKDDYVIAGPRKGLSIGEYEKNFKGKEIKRNLEKGASITEMSYIEPIKKLSTDELEKAKEKKITIPVRIHDLEIMRKNIGTGSYEFHLSYEEVLSENINNVLDICSADENYSIHLPDYIPGNRIFDPLSIDEETKHLSERVLQRTERLASLLEQLTGLSVPIVGSFSQRNNMLHDEFFERLFSDIIFNSNQSIYPQWLPVNAWYFGGTVKLDVFNSEKYIQLIEKNNVKICLDICHVVLSANSNKANYIDWLDRLMPYSGHLHVAEAVGEDGEGLPLGTGLPLDYVSILRRKEMKVIEVWQAHFDEGYKFKQAVKFLLEMEDYND